MAVNMCRFYKLEFLSQWIESQMYSPWQFTNGKKHRQWSRPRPSLPRKGVGVKFFPILAWIALTALGASLSPAQQDEPLEINREYAIKAAYLYNFVRYVEWPPEAFENNAAPFVIGVLGKDPLGSNLDEIANTKKIDGRKIIIKRFASMADYTPCHILFVSGAATATQKESAVKMTQSTLLLLVGEDAGFAEKGVAINFIIENNRVRFEINQEAAKQNKLKISSKLLSLAKIVGEKN
jgi:hypothetical protein